MVHVDKTNQMNNSKLKSAFGIDDILYQNQKASSKLVECLKADLSKNSVECSGTRSTFSESSNFQSDIYNNQLKKPLALFPPMMDFTKPNFCVAGISPSSQFSPTSYLEQYASALTKGKFCLCSKFSSFAN